MDITSTAYPINNRHHVIKGKKKGIKFFSKRKRNKAKSALHSNSIITIKSLITQLSGLCIFQWIRKSKTINDAGLAKLAFSYSITVVWLANFPAELRPSSDEMNCLFIKLKI